MEIKITFQIDGKDYILFIEKKCWHYKVYLFQRLERRILEPIPVEKMTTSTMREMLKYRWLSLTMYLRQKMKKKGRKPRSRDSRNCIG